MIFGTNHVHCKIFSIIVSPYNWHASIRFLPPMQAVERTSEHDIIVYLIYVRDVSTCTSSLNMRSLNPNSDLKNLLKPILWIHTQAETKKHSNIRTSFLFFLFFFFLAPVLVVLMGNFHLRSFHTAILQKFRSTALIIEHSIWKIMHHAYTGFCDCGCKGR